MHNVTTLTVLLLMEASLGFLTGIIGALVAKRYHGGALSSSVNWIVSGLITMSLGHMVMALDMIYGVDSFKILFGSPLGSIIFRVIVVFSLGSSLLGFLKLLVMGRSLTLKL